MGVHRTSTSFQTGISSTIYGPCNGLSIVYLIIQTIWHALYMTVCVLLYYIPRFIIYHTQYQGLIDPKGGEGM